jgi:hypothetical protein
VSDEWHLVIPNLSASGRTCQPTICQQSSERRANTNPPEIENRCGAVPAALLAATARVAVTFGRGESGVGVSTGAGVLAETYLEGMSATKFQVLAAAGLLAVLVTGGTLAQRDDRGQRRWAPSPTDGEFPR